MELIRLVVAAVSGLLLAGGYLASVNAFFANDAKAYSERIQSSSIPTLSLGLLLAITVLAMIPAPKADGEPGE